MMVTLRDDDRMTDSTRGARKSRSATKEKKPAVIAAAPIPKPSSTLNSTLGGNGAQPT